MLNPASTLVIATGNAGKLREIRRMTTSLPVEVVGQEAFAPLPEIIEDGATFAENALIKARIVCQATGHICLADDSGLVVDALDGAPGIYSARYAGPEADDGRNNAKLLQALEGVPADQRTAAFVCVMALVSPAGEEKIFEGRIEGQILTAPRGEGGFGYDPLFLVPEQDTTMAELPLDTKNRISHRGQALRAVIDYLQQHIG